MSLKASILATGFGAMLLSTGAQAGVINVAVIADNTGSSGAAQVAA